MQDVDWEAHSFLCGLGDDPLDGSKQVDALLGFSWGFRIRDGKISTEGPGLLAPEDWNHHHDYLREAFPRWSFLAGFSGGAAG